jgi:hypothetical protein
MAVEARAPDGPASRAPRTSDLLLALAAARREGHVSVGEMIDALGNRSFGVVFLVLALPAWIPVLPPGVPSIFGIAIAAVAAQMLLGRAAPWLPSFIARRGLSAPRFARLVARAAPWLRRIEAVCRQRLTAPVTGNAGSRLTALCCLGLALAICVPLPMTNSGPALSLAVMAVGLIERDGLAVLAGVALGVMSLAVMAAFWGGAVLALEWIVSR